MGGGGGEQAPLNSPHPVHPTLVMQVTSPAGNPTAAMMTPAAITSPLYALTAGSAAWRCWQRNHPQAAYLIAICLVPASLRGCQRVLPILHITHPPTHPPLFSRWVTM